jgi:uncharacterized phage protein (TIGR01671 family)
MRELKFRAWVFYGEKLKKPHYSQDYGSLSRFFEDHDENDDDQCIEQYTGLKDRDGKEIYEGDILQYFGATLVVEYHDEAFWAVKYDTKEAWNIRVFIGVSGARVIGSIHENAELLG